MDIIYRKDTLYVYVEDELDENLVGRLERRVDNIMARYGIERVVVDTRGQRPEFMHVFERRFNSRHKSKVIVK